MKYLYFSIYMFYKNIIKIESWGMKPSFYVNMIISLLEVMILSTIFDCSMLLYSKDLPVIYSPIIPFILTMILYFFNKKYFLKKEKNIIKDILKKEKKTIFCINLFSIIVVILILSLFFYKGDLMRERILGL